MHPDLDLLGRVSEQAHKSVPGLVPVASASAPACHPGVDQCDLPARRATFSFGLGNGCTQGTGDLAQLGLVELWAAGRAQHIGVQDMKSADQVVIRVSGRDCRRLAQNADEFGVGQSSARGFTVSGVHARPSSPHSGYDRL